jgi:hypothetical protein
VAHSLTPNLTMNTSVSYNVNAVVKEDDGPTIASAAVATLNSNPIIAAPTAHVETIEDEPTYLRDDNVRNRAEFFAGPEAMDTAIPSETSTMVTDTAIANNEVILLNESDTEAIDNSGDPMDCSTGEPLDLTSGEPMENTWNEPVESSDDHEPTTTEVSEVITATSSTTTQAGRSCDSNYDASGEFSDGDCP